MSYRALSLSIAVSTSVLAAMAVSASADELACPPGNAVQLHEPSLPWQTARTARPARKLRGTAPKLALRTAVGDSAALMRTLAKLEVMCAGGSGELTIRIARGSATVIASGLDPIARDCIVHAIESTRFPRISDGTIARVAIELR